ncbi:hypothetical protein U1Q18_051856 [Sarracenia purpurea var. burkii]
MKRWSGGGRGEETNAPALERLKPPLDVLWGWWRSKSLRLGMFGTAYKSVPYRGVGLIENERFRERFH